MSDLAVILTALFACIPPTLVALAALRSSRQNTKKADVIIAKAEEIHTSTNGSLTKANEALANANLKIEQLQQLVGALVESKKAR